MGKREHTWLVELRKSPVNDEHISCFIVDKHVLRLDVAVDNTAAVRVVQADQNFVHEIAEVVV